MHLIRRSCQSALLAPKAYAPLANGSQRAFSESSACCRGTLPQFLPASNPGLDGVLAKVNSKVLLPEHLNKEQAKLVYKKENKGRLEAETMEITLGDVTLPLEHIDRNRDQPNRRDTLRDVVAQSKTAEDWENVVRMLEGYHNAGINLKSNLLVMTVRKMNGAGMHHLVLKALQRADKTGLKLRDADVVREVFWGLHLKAVGSGWSEPETAKALNFAEQIVDLMENKEHLGKADPAKGDLRTSPYTIAWLLELAAVRAKKHTGGVDKDGKVLKYASRFMNALQQDGFNTAVLPKQLSELSTLESFAGKKFANVFDSWRKLTDLIPMWNALKTASQVLGAGMPAADVALRTEQALRAALAKGQKTVEDLSKKRKMQTMTSETLGGMIRACDKL